MIEFEEALKIILSREVFPEAEEVELSCSINRVLAQDAVSDMDMPPFNKSAVDGYACRRSDLADELKVLEIIPAGQIPQFRIKENECSKVMTGAMVPEGADCIIMIEDVEVLSSDKIKFTAEKTSDNICYTGEDIRLGDVVLKKGLLIKPQHIAVLASVGYSRPKVYRKPKVNIITTGDELVEPHQKPDVGKIRNSNAWQLIAQCEAMNVSVDYSGIAPDSKEETLVMIRKALADNDVILITGGVSMGDYDYVPDVLLEAGFTFYFKSVAMQPGRPTLFASHKSGKFCFGLPGNPVSSFNQFELLVKPLLYKMMGHAYKPVVLHLPLAKDFSRKKSKRLNFIPVLLNPEGEALPVEYHGSAHINSLNDAYGLMSIPIGTTEIKKGDIVNVRPV